MMGPGVGLATPMSSYPVTTLSLSSPLARFIIMYRSSLLVLAISLVLASSADTSPSPGDCICRQGYVMDAFCVERGRLLDSGAPTLQEPERHSMYCLLDVSICVESGFVVLGDPDASSTAAGGSDMMFSVAAKLDGAGNERMFEFAAARGKMSACKACTGRMGEYTKGFRAAVVGMVDATGDLSSSSDQSDPLSRAPLVEVVDILEDGGCANFDATTACSSVGGGGSNVGGDSTVSSAPSTAPTFQPSISAAPTVEASDPPSPSPTAMSQEMIDLLAAKAKWGQPARYEYVFYKSCHCMSEFVQPMHVIVKDGTKINVTYVEDAISGSESQDVINSVYTIEEQFMVIEQALSGPFKADSVVVDYDDELGYPLVLSIDYESAIADEEFQIFNSVQQQVRF
mmetsp:Transcript_19006/g.31507  ORF Transcript_19006/g.31507 Transcript_19006/m.31507 type:complete len:399 (-) Transcript_19006:85-1281(-)